MKQLLKSLGHYTQNEIKLISQMADTIMSGESDNLAFQSESINVQMAVDTVSTERINVLVVKMWDAEDQDSKGLITHLQFTYHYFAEYVEGINMVQIAPKPEPKLLPLAGLLGLILSDSQQKG